MNVEIGAEAALFPETEYINGIAVAVSLHNMETGTWKLVYGKGAAGGWGGEV
jgi:hypothetical protein